MIKDVLLPGEKNRIFQRFWKDVECLERLKTSLMSDKVCQSHAEVNDK